MATIFIPGSARALASCFRRLGEGIFEFEILSRKQKFAMARAPSPAREARALPRIRDACCSLLRHDQHAQLEGAVPVGLAPEKLIRSRQHFGHLELAPFR